MNLHRLNNLQGDVAAVLVTVAQPLRLSPSVARQVRRARRRDAAAPHHRIAQGDAHPGGIKCRSLLPS
jgi:hypothetical protein